jgi:hypothetical protein
VPVVVKELGHQSQASEVQRLMGASCAIALMASRLITTWMENMAGTVNLEVLGRIWWKE